MAINQTAETELTADEVKEYNYYVGMRQSLERLEANPDFQKVILEGYFKDKAINGVSMLATNYIRKNGLRPEVMEALVAISQLQDFFITIKQLGAEVDELDDGDEDSVEE
jgi:hypothetical protein